MFLNRKENRIRAGWRILLFTLIAFFSVVSISLITPSGLIRFVVISTAVTLLVWLFGHHADHRPFSAFGLQGGALWWKELFLGLALGSAAILLLFGAAVMLGYYEITGYGWEKSSLKGMFWTGFLAYMLTMVLVGYYEELLFRGYLNLNLFEGLRREGDRTAWIPAFVSIALISAFFGIAHGNNPNATVFGIVNVTLAGFMLGIPFLATGRLALPIGIHISWNAVQGGIVGVSVSGIPNRFSLLSSRYTDHEFITGGAFGFEGGILGTIGILAITIAVVAWLVHIDAVRVHEPPKE